MFDATFKNPVPIPTSQALDHVEIRRAAARRAFWSRHPLTDEFHKVRHEFSLKEFVAFVIDLPAETFDACMFDRGELR